jgi:hypothetical protein
MAGRSNRKKEEVAKRRADVAEMYLQGNFMADIAKKWNVSVSQVSYDLKAIYRLWKQSALKDFDQLKERELIKIDNLEKTYWEAWQKTTEDWEKEKKRYTEAQLRELNKEQIKAFGDPRYLQGVQWCINKRCEILGLDAPERVDLSSAGKSLKLKIGDQEFDV